MILYHKNEAFSLLWGIISMFKDLDRKDLKVIFPPTQDTRRDNFNTTASLLGLKLIAFSHIVILLIYVKSYKIR